MLPHRNPFTPSHGQTVLRGAVLLLFCLSLSAPTAAWARVLIAERSSTAATVPAGTEWSSTQTAVTASGDRYARYTHFAAELAADAVVEVAQLLATDRQSNDTLGVAVAVHEDLLAAGAPAWMADNLLDQNQRAGAVDLFARDPAALDQWHHIQKLIPSDGAPNDRFGWTVALDATHIAVGAPWADIDGNIEQGAIYLFARGQADPSQWVQIQKLTVADGVADDRFGRALALDGGTLLVGANEKAYLFASGGDGLWSLVKQFVASDGVAGDRFGDSVAKDGDVILIGADGAQVGENFLQGVAYLFLRDQGGASNWGEFKKLTGADGDSFNYFGSPVLLANNQAIIGANGKEQVYIYNRNDLGPDNWAEVQRLTSIDGAANYGFGARLAIGDQHLVVGSDRQAEVFAQVNVSDRWTPLRKLQGSAGSNVDFQSTLAIRGDRVFVGGPSTGTDEQPWHGAVYLFDITRPTAPTFHLEQAAYTVEEGIGTAALIVVLDRPSPYPFTIAYTTAQIEHEATPWEDYTPVSGTLTIPTSATQGTIGVPISNDDRLELSEQFRLILGNAPGALAGDPREALLTILDDDPIANCDYIATDEASLDRAIRCLYVAQPGAYTIQVTADISLTRPLPLLVSPNVAEVSIAGNGHTIDAQGHGRVLAMYKIKAEMRDLTLRGGRLPMVDQWELPNYGGAIYADTPNIGFATEPSCGLTLTNVILTDNEAYAGGGLYYGCELPLTLSNTTMSDNRAVFGGAFSTAGGEEFFTEAYVTGSTFSGNQATHSGGAFDLAIGDGGIILHLTNSTVSGNQAMENGGGLFLDQSWYDGRSEVQLINSTVADNEALAGSGVYNHFGILAMSNSLVATNRGSSNCAFFVSGDGNGQLISHGSNLDSDGSCLPEGVRQPSDIPGGNANLGPLADHGGPSSGAGQATLTHALLAGSDALDAADNAVCLAEPVKGVDQRGVPRPQGVRCDIGAFEAEADAPAGAYLFVSSRSSGNAGDLAFRDEDIVMYDFALDSWRMIFDGSDIGVTKDVNAFAFLADGTLLLSFNAATAVPGLGTVDDSDIVQFIPTTLGPDTAGSFAWYLHGADVGLTTDGEDIDAIGFTADGQLVVSTIGDFAAGDFTAGDFTTLAASGHDEDLFQLDNAILGTPSRGEWHLFFDGSGAGLANEDVNGFWIDPGTGEYYITVKDSFAFDNVQIDADDIFVCTPISSGDTTTCAYRLFWDSDAHGYGAENLDSFGVGTMLTTLIPAPQARNAEALTPEEAVADDDADDLDGDELNREEVLNRVFLPLIGK